jgi:hypothetical protein
LAQGEILAQFRRGFGALRGGEMRARKMRQRRRGEIAIEDFDAARSRATIAAESWRLTEWLPSTLESM